MEVEARNKQVAEDEADILVDAMHEITSENNNVAETIHKEVKIDYNAVLKGMQEKIAIMPLKEFRNSINLLNEEQRMFYEHFKTNLLHTTPMHLFLTGGAGVGKTCVTLACIQCAQRMYEPYCTVRGNQYPIVLVMSFTGSASFNVFGNTSHSVLHIDPHTTEYKPLPNEKLNTIRERYQNVKVIVIDEISLISAELFWVIHCRLCEINQKTDFSVLFGGYHVLLVGDLFQLKPVHGSWVFQAPSNSKHTNVALWDGWRQFKLFELTKVMRTQHTEWAYLLNRVREGKQTTDDINLLQQMSNKEIPKHIRWICYKNNDVDRYNQQYYDDFPGVGIDCLAQDCVKINNKLYTLDNNLQKLVSEMKIGDKNNMVDNLPLKINIPLELVTNLDTTDGLTNGADCKPLHIQRNDIGEVDSMFVQFSNKRCGKKRTEKLHGVQGVHFKRLTKSFRVKIGSQNSSKYVIRTQFPLRLAASKTIHRVQGLTWPRYAIELRTVSRIPEGMFYVALSRGPDPVEIFLPGFKKSWITVDKRVVQEMEYLRANKVLHLQYPFHSYNKENKLVVLTHNCGGLNVEDYTKHPAVQHADILFLCETKHSHVKNNIPSIICAKNSLRCVAGTYIFSHTGCLLYLNDSIRIVSCVANTIASSVEIIICEMQVCCNQNVLFIGIYKCVNKGASTLQQLFSTIWPYVLQNTNPNKFEKIIFTGDFNIANKRAPNNNESYLDVECGRYNLVDLLPFRSTTLFKTCIDYMLVSPVLKHCNVDVGVYFVEIHNGHHMLYASFQM
jgi:hypothetical protein